MWYCMATVSIGGRRMVASWRISIIAVLQLDQLCRKQGKCVEVAYVFPFCPLWGMPDLSPKGIELGMKPSAPSCPPTLPPYSGLQSKQTESQRTPPRRVALVSVKTQTEIQTAQVEVQTTPVSVRPQTTLVSIETQTIEVRDEMEDRRQREKENMCLQSIPGIICAEQPERLRKSHTSCCLFMKHPPGEIISLWELISLSLIKKYKESRRIWETRGPRKIY